MYFCPHLSTKSVTCSALLPALISALLSVSLLGAIGCEEAAKPKVEEMIVEQISPPIIREHPRVPPAVSPMLRPPEETMCGAEEIHFVAPHVIRRLTRVEYLKTLQTLTRLDAESLKEVMVAFPPDEEVLGFDNQSSSLQVSAVHVEQYMKAAVRLSEMIYAQLEQVSPCLPSDELDETCLIALIDSFGTRAWRRPLTSIERETLIALFNQSVEAAQADLISPDAHLLGSISPLKDGVTSVIEALLQSPYFLYRVEIGRAPTESELKAGVTERQLSGYEVASRLSYLLWRSMPDEALFQAAEDGRLEDPESRLIEAERMLLDPKASDGLWSFFEQWLALDEISRIDKDIQKFPSYTRDLNALLATEARLFVEESVFTERDLRTLFEGSFSFQNRSLALHYTAGGEGSYLPEELADRSLEWASVASGSGAEVLPEGDSFERVELNPDRRSGLLTRGGVLALTTKPYMGDPIHRGIYVRERLLCTPLPPPPPDIVVIAPDPDPELTTREQFAIHSAEPACAGCHSLVDPLGFGLERFDPIGRWRETENGKVIDDSGEVIATLDLNGPFEGAQELSALLAQSEQVQRCVVLNFYRYAKGRAERQDEVCHVDQLYREYAESDYDFLSLLRAIISSSTFTLRAEDTDDQEPR
jgi:hypothetical protein